MTTHFDLLVLGGGSGGIATARKAASYGAHVGLIEKGDLGGTCVNLGCVPKKIMWYAAQLAEAYQQGADYGFHLDMPKLNFATLVAHRTAHIKKLNSIYQEHLEKSKVTLIKGQASFVDPHSIKVNDQLYSAKHIVIATGASPKQMTIPGSEFSINSDGFFDLTHLPKKAAIIGGGYIAIELASILRQFGTEVKILLRGDKPLRNFDTLISDTVSSHFSAEGIDILKNCEVTQIEHNKNDKLTVYCKNKESIAQLDTVLFAIGRQPNTQDLNLNAAQIKTNDSGHIITDQWETTNLAHIYAIGDVTGKKPLTPVAIAAGKYLATRLFDGKTDAHLDYDNIPSVIFSHPPIGTVGLSEQAAIETYGKHAIKTYQTEFNPLLYAIGTKKNPTKMKLVTLQETGKIIGCHLIGLAADEILQGFAVAIKMGATKSDFDQTVAIHPTSAEELVLM